MYSEPIEPVAALPSRSMGDARAGALDARIYPLAAADWGMSGLNQVLLFGEGGIGFRLPGFAGPGRSAFRDLAMSGPSGLVIDGYLVLSRPSGRLRVHTDRPHSLMLGGVVVAGDRVIPLLRPGIYALELAVCLIEGDVLPPLLLNGHPVPARMCRDRIEG